MVKSKIECQKCGNEGIFNTDSIPCTLECRFCGNKWRVTWNEEKPGTILVTDLSTGKQYEGWVPVGR
jgi:uncharacterized Zn finger protein